MNLNEQLNKITSMLPGGSFSNCGGMYKIYIILFLFIIIYHFILRSLFKDNFAAKDSMNQNVLYIPNYGCISWWPISHFILYFIFGLLFPDCILLAMSVGIIWEIYESAYGWYYKNYIGEQKVMSNGSIQYEEWWGGRVSDIVFNLLGFLTGMLFAKYLNIHIKIPYLN